MILYINGVKAELAEGTVIAQTKQVNNLASIDTRQANFTNTFKLPKTATNTRIMEYMAIPGNTTLIPYNKILASLYAESGECFIYNGRAIVTDAGDTYDVALVDGIVDLYKAIENKALSDLDLTGIGHSKDVATVVASFTAELPYLYILADYNGNPGDTTPETGTPHVNIDYLVPSVKVSWLWDLIMTTFAVTYSGAIFNTFNFQNLWLTFPKGLGTTGENDHPVFHSDDYDFQSPNVNGYYYAKVNLADLNELNAIIENRHLKVADTATYRFEITGTLFGSRVQGSVQPQPAQIRIVKNSEGLDPLVAWNNGVLTQSNYYVFGSDADSLAYGVEFELTSAPFQLNELESVAVVITRGVGETGSYILNPADDNELEVTLVRVDPNIIDFTQAFTDFSIKDFINEIVQRFGLTLFKDKYSKNYAFLTLQEVLQNTNVVDWSKKYHGKDNEAYAFGSYAQRNFMRYTYNDKEASHNDAFIAVENVNLTDTRDVLQSKIYSPERQRTTYIGQEGNVYKLWDKEVKEDDTINYKQLDKRYYLMRADPVTDTPISVYSEALGTSDDVTAFYRESFFGLSFTDIKAAYYNPLAAILDRTQIVTAYLWLTDADVVPFDFKSLIYIEQLSNYYLVNAIQNYVPGKVTKVELVRVLYSDTPVLANAINLVGVAKFAGQDAIAVTFTKDYDGGTLTLERSLDNLTWSTVADADLGTVWGLALVTPYIGTGLNYFRINDTANTVISNSQSLLL